MIKILLSGLSNGYGGVETIILNIIKYMNNERFRFDFILPTGLECIYKKQIEKSNGKIYKVTTYGKNPVQNKKELEAILKESHYDFIWINTSLASIITLQKVARRYSKAKIIVHSHGTSFESKNKIKDFSIQLFHNINYIKLKKLLDYKFACSKSAGKWLFGEKILDVNIIKNGIEAEKFQYNLATREEYRKKFNLKNKLIIGHVARFTYIKNQLFLLDVFNEIYKQNSEAILMLVGDGEFRSQIEKRIIDLGLEKQVILTGIRSDIAELMQMMDVFILPSYFEGLPLVGIEAQASGLMCFFSNTISNELKITDLSFFISLKKTEKQWADIIVKNLNYERRNTYNEIVKAGYDIKEVAKNLEKFFINEKK